MVELFEQDIRTNDRQSSKGNQLKWKNNHIWYKADYAGYEGLAEIVVSRLLEKSSLDSKEYVHYESEQIRYREQIYSGVKSKDFLEGDWQIITLERLFQSFFQESLYKAIYRMDNSSSRLSFLVEQVERLTGLKDFGRYMNRILTIDAFFLNEDRHTHNIAVLTNGVREFRLCPIFDHGAALLSDTKMDYPLTGDVYHFMEEVGAKTICRDFDEQLDVSEELYGENLKFYFTRKDVDDILSQMTGYHEQIIERVRTVLYMQMRKYKYLF